jgi:hypothetical protein
VIEWVGAIHPTSIRSISMVPIKSRLNLFVIVVNITYVMIIRFACSLDVLGVYQFSCSESSADIHSTGWCACHIRLELPITSV